MIYFVLGDSPHLIISNLHRFLDTYVQVREGFVKLSLFSSLTLIIVIIHQVQKMRTVLWTFLGTEGQKKEERKKADLKLYPIQP